MGEAWERGYLASVIGYRTAKTKEDSRAKLRLDKQECTTAQTLYCCYGTTVHDVDSWLALVSGGVHSSGSVFKHR